MEKGAVCESQRVGGLLCELLRERKTGSVHELAWGGAGWFRFMPTAERGREPSEPESFLWFCANRERENGVEGSSRIKA
ncbi:hypothetical protein MA16_Dca027335 [Dendrobium catenatum]|uniref:Uncharacterized protein n=1 Tax=Dendrobium catenatum TaxID=906689 RepID=A0A2I0V6W1_9ASPA|nr:hypothetical protein MA16_Dca027335 [Dendrobium catenatum]